MNPFILGLSLPLFAGAQLHTSTTWSTEFQVAQADLSPCFEWSEVALDFVPSSCKSLSDIYVRDGYLPRAQINKVVGCYGPACPSYQ